MKTDEPRDDEILGRALSRAIETNEVTETPYDRSRIGSRPVKHGTSFWRVAALAASIVVAGALGSTLLERPAIDGPVAQQPTPSAVASTTSLPQGASATPGSPSSTAEPNAIDHQRVFVSATEGVPPTSQHVNSVLGKCAGCTTLLTGVPTTAEDRIRSRLNSLNRAFSGLTATPLNADPVRACSGRTTDIHWAPSVEAHSSGRPSSVPPRATRCPSTTAILAI